MHYDSKLLNDVESNSCSPTLRIFRFKEPTVSYGRLQKIKDMAPLIPKGWSSVQRPTGGGVVLHQNDLCLSLCWPAGIKGIPQRPQEQYQWIHAIILQAINPSGALHMASCCDVEKPTEPFATRTCFKNPVGFDLMKNKEKIVGGALRCTRRATLYQGSLQMAWSSDLEFNLLHAFRLSLPRGS